MPRPISSIARGPDAVRQGYPRAMTPPRDRLVVHAGRLLDVRTGELRPDVRLLVEDERIAALLGPGDPGPDAASARLVDLGRLTVMPGLIDCHAHLVGDVETASVASTTIPIEEELAISARNAIDTLRAGVTAVRDLGPYRGLLDLELQRRIDAGLIEGPRMQCSGAMITRPHGGGEITGDPEAVIPPAFRVGVVRDVREIEAVVERLIEAGAGAIKLIVTGAVLTRGTKVDEIELDGPLVEAAVRVAAGHGVFVAAHAHGARGIQVAAEAGVRSIEHGSLLDQAGIAAMLDHGTWLVADVYDGDWIDEVGRRDGWPAETLAKNTATTEAQRRGFQAARAAGVRVAFGTDSGVYPHRFVARQFPIMARLGMTPLEVIRSATTDAAEMIGWDDRVGSLEPGRFADLVAYETSPLEDIDALARPSVVMQGGRIARDERSA